MEDVTLILNKEKKSKESYSIQDYFKGSDFSLNKISGISSLSEKSQETLLAKQYFENVFRMMYKDFYKKRFTGKFTREYYELEIFFVNNVYPLLKDGITLESLETIWSSQGLSQSDRKLVFNLAYFSDYTNLEEFEVLYFVAKKVFPEKFKHLVDLDRRMIYYVRKKIQLSKKLFVSSILNKQEYYFLLKLRNVCKERLTREFLNVAQAILVGFLCLKKMEVQVANELRESDVSKDDVVKFVVEVYPELGLTLSEIKNSLRSFKRYFESGSLPESLEGSYSEEDKELVFPS